MKQETKKAAKAREIQERADAKKTMLEALQEKINATPIAKAVAPLKTDAITRAGKDAKEYTDRLLKVLADNGNDLNKVAPYPRSSNISREQYRTALNRHNLYSSITKDREKINWFDTTAPRLVDADPQRIERFIETAKEFAAQQYDAFIHKLVDKIGDTVSAELSGNHIWAESFLTVELPSGEKQIWKTQQIVNCSVYGLLFNQWPTRQVKKGA